MDVTFDPQQTIHALKLYEQSFTPNNKHLFLKIAEKNGKSYLKAEPLTFWDRVLSLFGANKHIKLDSIVTYLSTHKLTVDTGSNASKAIQKIITLYQNKHPNSAHTASIVNNLINVLQNTNHMRAEGIFRTSPPKISADVFISDLKKNQEFSQNHDVHEYALALKTFVKELCFLDETNIEKFINAKNLSEASEAISIEKRDIFVKLIHFLHDVSVENSIANPGKAMSFANMATMFTPNIAPSQTDLDLIKQISSKLTLLLANAA